MKKNRFSTVLVAAGLFAAFGLSALCPQVAVAQDPHACIGASYIITNTDSTGAFVSRGVVALHGDHTLAVTDSGQGGPTYFFSSQLGSWSFDSKGDVVGRTIDFDFAPDNDTVRLDYNFKFEAGGKISGSVTILYFPQTADPLGSGGTPGGTITFTGYRINP
jgi:hypothetical protein